MARIRPPKREYDTVLASSFLIPARKEPIAPKGLRMTVCPLYWAAWLLLIKQTENKTKDRYPASPTLWLHGVPYNDRRSDTPGVSRRRTRGGM
jgi:hypothetical protein